MTGDAPALRAVACSAVLLARALAWPGAPLRWPDDGGARAAGHLRRPLARPSKCAAGGAPQAHGTPAAPGAGSPAGAR